MAAGAAAAAAACASPSPAAGAGKRGGAGIRRSAGLSAPPGDLEVTSGGCRVRQLENRAGCARLLREVPDLTLLPCYSAHAPSPPSPLAASSAIQAQAFPPVKKLPF